MGSWSIFRRTRVSVFVLITVISLLLTVVYAIFISKDFSLYTKFQRVIVASAAAIHGITAILMYLMLAVRYSAKLDALRIAILLCLHTAITTLFTIKSTNMACTAFKGGAMCRQVASATAITSWVLCGLLVVYGACLAIMTCVPQPPPPFDVEPELDTRVPVKSQTRHTPHLSSDSNTRLIDLEKQSGSAHPLLGPGSGSSGSVGESMRIGRPMPLQRGVQQNASYGSSEYPVNAPQIAMRENDETLPFWPADESGRMQSLDGSRSYPPSYASADAAQKPLSLRPGSIYSNSPSASYASVGFVNNTRSSTLPPPQQSNVQKAMSRRTRRSSISVYSTSSRESEDFIPPVPLLDAYRTSSPGPQLVSDAYRTSSPGPQLVSDAYRTSSPRPQFVSDASRTSSPRPQFVRPRADSGPWQQLVLDAAAGRQSIHLG